MTRRIRHAQPEDAAAIAAIYAPYCERTSITFEIEPLSAQAMTQRMQTLGEKYPWLVMDVGGVVAGYAYAGPHHERAAYRWSANVSVYIADGFQRQGIGRSLYQSLFGVMRLQGFVHAIAGITMPNAPSVALHESLGFRLVGIYPQVGFKLGAWRDVGWWQLPLVEPLPASPGEPLLMAEVLQDPRLAAVLNPGKV